MVLGRFKDTYFRSTSLLNSAIYRPNKAFQRSLLINRAFARQLIFCDPIVTRTFEGKTVTRRLAKSKITLESVKAAARKAKAGAEYDLTDPQCPGLQLRVRGGEVTRAVRAQLFGKQRRWVVGNAETKPDVARERAGELKSWCRRGQNPEKLVTQFSTGISIAYQVRVAGERPPPSWPWEKAVDKFLEHILAVRSGSTYDDYAGCLGGKRRSDPKTRHAMVPELKRFRRLDVLAAEGYYFPARLVSGRRTKNPHLDPAFINHALQYMPGVNMSCHSWRRGFASHGQRELGFSLGDIKLILDHSEGAPPGDVTAGHYALDPMIAKKREMMVKWLAWLELQVQAAIAQDPLLLDPEAVGESIFRARYGDERWEKRFTRMLPASTLE